jgi:hypothetical protein
MNEFLNSARKLVFLGDEFIASHGPTSFAQKASELLAEAKMEKLFELAPLVEASFQKDFNPQQNYASFQFSDLPVTLAMGNHCFLDLYFWRRRPTVIHDHHFTGAFQCLVGNNLDLEFEFHRTRKLGDFHEVGELKLIQKRQMTPGAIARIELLDKFIHQNHHQADLTVNLCFRTPDFGKTNLSNFLYSGLRFEKDQGLIARLNRLEKVIFFEGVHINQLELTLDDALAFVIRHHRSQSQGRKFLELMALMEKRVTNESGIDLPALLDYHDNKMDELENAYE